MSLSASQILWWHHFILFCPELTDEQLSVIEEYGNHRNIHFQEAGITEFRKKYFKQINPLSKYLAINLIVDT